MPLSGVRINLYKCGRYDNILGCQSKLVFATRSTDQNGEYSFTQSELNQSTEGIVLSRGRYWDVEGHQGEVLMEPEALVDITLKASRSYPDTSIFEMSTTSELGNGSAKSFRAPKDSSISYRLFGNEQNIIKWVVYTSLPRCHIYCPRDTLATGSLTLDPQKFETLKTSINY